ncbi:hypothetical protein BKA69DRAFT_8777 [Paraphysoderma sedebokerense]|nr:hypothetical protein BKA69DRAFT_8777 [Paraphysoderma sedebokerense]
MKFGKQLERKKIPEWARYYINYKRLKQILKELKQQKIMEKEIYKVDEFYQKKVLEISNQLLSLQMTWYQSRSFRTRAGHTQNIKESFAAGITKVRILISNMDQFLQMNRLAIYKILKKHDKITMWRAILPVMESTKQEKAFWMADDLVQLASDLNNFEYDVTKSKLRRKIDTV